MTRGPAPESLPQDRETPDAWFGRIFLYRRGRMAAFMMLLLFALLIGIHSLRVAETRDEADTALHLLSLPAAGVQRDNAGRRKPLCEGHGLHSAGQVGTLDCGVRDENPAAEGRE